MSERYFHLDQSQQGSLQERVRETILAAIHSGTLPKDSSLPSCRRLSEQLAVSRNTIALVYEGLVEDGYLISRPRSGYFLHPDIASTVREHEADAKNANHLVSDSFTKETEQKGQQNPSLDHASSSVNWQERFSHTPSNYISVPRPSDWVKYPYPFIYGQREGERFPLAQWRVAARRLLDEKHDRLWLNDSYDQDDPGLIEQLRTRILPKRGIVAEYDEILITLGSQNALFLLSQLLLVSTTRVAMENPGYRDAYNIFKRQGAQLDLCSVDSEGITLNNRCRNSDYVYVTPSQQVPCGIPMSTARRRALLNQAVTQNQIIIEDDYDADLNLVQTSLPALRSYPEGGRVIYLSSFSKSLSPGLRLGYIVADAELIDELRALRRLMYRHPPTSLQRQLAQFIAQGHFDRCLRHHQQDTQTRWEILESARERFLPDCQRISAEYTNAFWLSAPKEHDTDLLRWRAAHKGVLIEPGTYHFISDGETPAPKHFLRLGFGAIKEDRIKEGIRLLGEAFYH